jgi:NAD(P)-dependent dehydrogenase (short-subunit alcohol dehydrogenase family)
MSSNKIVFITGANTGIGYQIVRGLCASDQSYTILLGGRSIEKAKKAVQDVTSEFPDAPSKVQPVQIDIEDDASIQASAQFVESSFGRLDALVNNAGMPYIRPY